MRALVPLTLALSLAAATAAAAATFERTPIAPDQGLDALTRRAAREQVGRDVFSNPYAAVTIGSVDVYNVFPYVEARTFEVVSDPRWNRLVYGEAGRTLKAYDGAGTGPGPLAAPRGMAVDEYRRLYVADTGNDRILALDAVTEYGEISLRPAFEVRGLAGPYAVAYSDGGTPFVPGDDFLYVADTGRNRVALFALDRSGAAFRSAIGELGSGRGRFAGPMAVAAGRGPAGHGPDVYVADAHNRRIVRLRHDGTSLRWISEGAVEAELVTSLDTDQWGNVYAAAPHRGTVRKFNAGLAPVAELGGGLNRPRAFHVPFVTVNDHRLGRTERVGRPNALAVEQWGDASGLQLWKLGLEIPSFAIRRSPVPEAQFDLTDRAVVTLECVEPLTGRTLSRRTLGELDAGSHAFALAPDEAAEDRGERLLRLSAASGYADGPVALAQARLGAPGAGLPGAAGLVGHSPNPAGARTRIAFVVPAGSGPASLVLLDAAGRRVRLLGAALAPGPQSLVWDATDDRGRDVAAGVYFYRLDAGGQHWTRKLVLVR